MIETESEITRGEVSKRDVQESSRGSSPRDVWHLTTGDQMTERVYRDPVHGSVSFNWREDRAIIELIDSREFQRLRRIRQLGAAAMVFPGAEHSRFTHSMGVAFLTKRLFDHLMRQELFPPEASPLTCQSAVILSDPNLGCKRNVRSHLTIPKSMIEIVSDRSLIGNELPGPKGVVKLFDTFFSGISMEHLVPNNSSQRSCPRISPLTPMKKLNRATNSFPFSGATPKLL